VPPTPQFSPPFGEVTVIVLGRIVKSASLMSSSGWGQTVLTLTLQFVDGVFGIVQEYGEWGTPPATGNQVPPELVEYAIVYPKPLPDHTILCTLPATHDSPPLGDVTVRAKAGAKEITNVATTKAITTTKIFLGFMIPSSFLKV